MEDVEEEAQVVTPQAEAVEDIKKQAKEDQEEAAPRPTTRKWTRRREATAKIAVFLDPLDLPVPLDDQAKTERLEPTETQEFPVWRANHVSFTRNSRRANLLGEPVTPPPCPPCPRGPPGPPGSAGEKGGMGAPGPDGDKGEDGEAGEQGAKGHQGPKGPPGKEGPIGERGPAGENGQPKPGLQGPPGRQGSQVDEVAIMHSSRFRDPADPRDSQERTECPDPKERREQLERRATPERTATLDSLERTESQEKRERKVRSRVQRDTFLSRYLPQILCPGWRNLLRRRLQTIDYCSEKINIFIMSLFTRPRDPLLATTIHSRRLWGILWTYPPLAFRCRLCHSRFNVVSSSH